MALVLFGQSICKIFLLRTARIVRACHKLLPRLRSLQLMRFAVYHVHEYPVPPNQNCTATGPHLDPEIRGEQPPCDPTQPQTCQVGDLAGKHGNVTSSPFQVFYLDLYQSTIPGTPAYIGNRSIVVHNNQGVRITCANLTMVQSEVVNSTYGISPSSSGASCSAPTQPPTTTIPIPASFTGAATANRAGSAAALLVGVLLSALL